MPWGKAGLPGQSFGDLVCVHAIFRPSRKGVALPRYRQSKLKNRGTAVTDKNGFFDLSKSTLSRRTALKGLAAGAGLTLAPGFVRYSQAQSSAPIKIGFQSHRTGIGAWQIGRAHV